MPRLRILLPALLLSLCLPAAAQQVYRSSDAQGNITFSDKPTSGSEAVTIDAPNVADPVAVPPPSATPVAQPEPEPKPAIEAAPDLEGDISKAPNTRKNKKKRRRNRPTPFDYEYDYGQGR